MTSRESRSDPWVVRRRPDPAARLRLFCLPYAGGGTRLFHGWEEELPEQIEVCALRLPGRESRFNEEPHRRVETLTEAIGESLTRYLDRPYAFLGHSMGALLGFELTRKFRRDGNRLPLHLFVSGRHAPHTPDPYPPIHHLPQDEFLAELRRHNGTPLEVLEHPELMDLVMPTLRADFSVCETYSYSEGPPIDSPISAFGGIEDPDIKRVHLEPWAEQTTGSFVVRLFPGDHFFIRTARSSFLRAVAGELRPHLK